MKFTNEEKDIIELLITNELNYYEDLEEIGDIEVEYIQKLKTILEKVGEK